MPGLWELLGYDEVAVRLATTLEHQSMIAMVEGPPGVGKSWLANGIGALWNRAGGRTVVAQGDLLRSDISLYPLGFAMAGLSNGWRTLGSSISDVTRIGESLAGTAGIVTATVKSLLAMRPSRQRAKALFLGDAEQQILFDLEHLADGAPFLLIADNIHWWDEASLELLGRLREQRMRDAFPFLAQMRVLAVQAIEPFQSIAHPQAHEALLSAESVEVVRLPRVRRHDFGAVLVALGAPMDTAHALAEAVFAVTGGHLALAGRCARHMAEGDLASFEEFGEPDAFLTRLLTDRIRSLGPNGARAIELLRIAAVLGLRFRRDEVSCAWEGERGELPRLLRYLRDQDVLGLSDDAGWFVHDLYRQHFLSAGQFDRTSVHERLSECLRILNPGEYELRCQNAVEAERVRDAAALGVQAWLSKRRDGGSINDLSATTHKAIEAGRMVPVLDRLSEATDLLDKNEFAACRAVLSSFPHSLPLNLLAEIDYLRASCLMATRSLDDSAQARDLLESWSGYEDEEVELGVRMLQLRLYSLVLLPGKGPGREVVRRIRDVLGPRTTFDRAAEDAMYILDRCAGGLDEPDVALSRVRGAASYFGPEGSHAVIRRPLEYHRCLTNLAALLIVNGKYREAQSVSADIARLTSDFAPGVFARLDYADANALLADHRLGEVNIAEAIARQRAIVERPAVTRDPFFAGNALAVYLALARRPEESLELLDDLLDELAQRRRPEIALEYLLRANRAAVAFTSAAHVDIRGEWAELQAAVESIAYPIGGLLVRRHHLLREVVDRRTVMSPQEFDTCLTVGPARFGPLWDQVGRGFWLPELEWWS